MKRSYSYFKGEEGAPVAVGVIRTPQRRPLPARIATLLTAEPEFESQDPVEVMEDNVLRELLEQAKRLLERNSENALSPPASPSPSPLLALLLDMEKQDLEEFAREAPNGIDGRPIESPSMTLPLAPNFSTSREISKNRNNSYHERQSLSPFSIAVTEYQEIVTIPPSSGLLSSADLDHDAHTLISLRSPKAGSMAARFEQHAQLTNNDELNAAEGSIRLNTMQNANFQVSEKSKAPAKKRKLPATLLRRDSEEERQRFVEKTHTRLAAKSIFKSDSFSRFTPAYMHAERYPVQYTLTEDYTPFYKETTGLARSDEIIEIAAVELIDGKRTGLLYHSLINPSVDVHPDAAAVHGKTKTDLQCAPPATYVLYNFIKWVGEAPLVAHNARFDLRFLQMGLDKLQLGQKLREKPVICTMQLCKALFVKQCHKLDDVAARFNVPLLKHRNVHTALIDAEILAECVQALAKHMDNVNGK